MRDVVLSLLFVSALPYALRHPYAGVLLWTWVSMMNPHKLTYGFASTAPFAAVSAAVTFIALVITKDRVKFSLTGPVVVLLVFVAWMCATTAFAVHPDESWVQLNKVLKIQLMTMIAIAVLHTRRHIELFLWVTALSVAFYGVKGGIFTITTGGGGRVWGPPGGFIEGNNELGLALVVIIPLLVFLRSTVDKAWMRQAMTLVIALCAASALGTQSRGAMLAIASAGFVLWLRSQRKLLSGILILVFAVLLVGFMPDTWSDRMGTIKTYQDDGSAMGRINAWYMAFNLACDRFFGGGFAVYTADLFAVYAPDPTNIKVAHSIYFSVLGEHGFVGLLLFLCVWFVAFRMAAKLRKRTRKEPELQWVFYLCGMCQVALVGYGVGGAFLSLAYFDLPYNIFAVLVVLTRWVDLWRPGTVDPSVFPLSGWRTKKAVGTTKGWGKA